MATLVGAVHEALWEWKRRGAKPSHILMDVEAVLRLYDELRDLDTIDRGLPPSTQLTKPPPPMRLMNIPVVPARMEREGAWRLVTDTPRERKEG